MKVSITGADGFLGSYLSDYLEKKAIQVNKITRMQGYDLRNINSSIYNSQWDKILSDSDALVHCASKVHDFSKTSYKEFKEVNVDASCALLKLAIKKKLNKFIFISTIKVLGEYTPLDKPFDAKSEPNPIGNYSFSKLEAERKLTNIANKNDIDLIIIRPPLIYGPNVGANFLKMMNIIYKKIPLPFKNIKNKRSNVFVGNLSDLIYTCITKKNLKENIFLVSDKELVSSIKLMEMISLDFDSKTKLFSFPLKILSLVFYLINKKSQFNRIKDSLVVDSSETNNILNWDQPFSMSEGLRITTASYLSKKRKEK